MEITSATFFSFLSNYLLAFTVCFIGTFIREAHTANVTRTKIQIGRILAEAIAAAFVSNAINKYLCDKFQIVLEIRMTICFVAGFWSDSILDLLSNRTLIISFIRGLLGNFGSIGKAISEAIKTAEEDNKTRKENYKNMKNGSKNENKESEKDK